MSQESAKVAPADSAASDSSSSTPANKTPATQHESSTLEYSRSPRSTSEPGASPNGSSASSPSSAAPAASASTRVPIPAAQFVDQEIAEHFICSICDCLASNPPNLPCGHLACWDCLEKQLAWSLPLQEDVPADALFRFCSHPGCRSSFVLQECPPNRFCIKQMETLRVRCAYADMGCGWQQKLGPGLAAYAIHARDCSLKPMVCTECKERVIETEMDSHKQERCVRRLVTCEHCKSEFKWEELSSHQDHAFGCKSIVECPYGCKQEVSTQIQHEESGSQSAQGEGSRDFPASSAAGATSSSTQCQVEGQPHNKKKKKKKAVSKVLASSSAAAVAPVELLAAAVLSGSGKEGIARDEYKAEERFVTRGTRDFIDEHIEVCPLRTVECELCGEKVRWNEMEQHEKHEGNAAGKHLETLRERIATVDEVSLDRFAKEIGRQMPNMPTCCILIDRRFTHWEHGKGLSNHPSVNHKTCKKCTPFRRVFKVSLDHIPLLCFALLSVHFQLFPGGLVTACFEIPTVAQHRLLSPDTADFALVSTQFSVGDYSFKLHLQKEKMDSRKLSWYLCLMHGLFPVAVKCVVGFQHASPVKSSLPPRRFGEHRETNIYCISLSGSREMRHQFQSQESMGYRETLNLKELVPSYDPIQDSITMLCSIVSLTVPSQPAPCARMAVGLGAAATRTGASHQQYQKVKVDDASSRWPPAQFVTTKVLNETTKMLNDSLERLKAEHNKRLREEAQLRQKEVSAAVAQLSQELKKQMDEETQARQKALLELQTGYENIQKELASQKRKPLSDINNSKKASEVYFEWQITEAFKNETQRDSNRFKFDQLEFHLTWSPSCAGPVLWLWPDTKPCPKLSCEVTAMVVGHQYSVKDDSYGGINYAKLACTEVIAASHTISRSMDTAAVGDFSRLFDGINIQYLKHLGAYDEQKDSIKFAIIIHSAEIAKLQAD